MSEAALSHSGAISVPDRVATGPSQAGPVQPTERIKLLDVLRGFALFGILLVNWGSNYISDGVLDGILEFVAEYSFRALFSFVFGLGFAIQLLRADEKGRPIVGRYLWRTALLLMIGAAHYVLIWDGDIAYRYALLAVPLLIFYRWPPTLLIVAAGALLLLYMAPPANFRADGRYWLRPNPEIAEVERADLQRRRELTFPNQMRWEHGAADGELAARAAGVAANFGLQLRRAYHFDFFKEKGDILCMFLLGLYAGRRRILHDPARHRRLLLGTVAVGLLVGVAGNTLEVYGDWVRSLIAVPEIFGRWRFTHLGNIGLTLAYLSGISLLWTYRNRARRVLAPLGHAGRMSLTNYIMQAVILTALMGDGTLFGRGFVPQLGNVLDGWWRVVLLTGVFAFQVLYSRWWFQHFQFGPVEWLWRSLTWFRWQPIRVRVEQSATP